MLRKLLAVMSAALLLAVCLTVPAMAEQEDTLFNRAISLAQRMNENTKNEAYLALLTEDENAVALVQHWGAGHGLPKMVAQTTAEASLIKMLARQTIGEIGTEILAATTMMETVTIFAGDDVGDGAYVILYDNHATPILVVWHSEDGAVRMRAMYLPFADLSNCYSRSDVDNWFRENEIPLTIETAVAMPIVVAEPVEGNLLERALSAAKGMDAKADDEEYCASLGASEELLALMKAWAAGDAEAPVLAVKTDLSLDSDSVKYVNETLLPGVEVDETLLAKGVNQIPLMLMGRNCGTEVLAASSMIREEILFAESKDAMTGLFLFIYEDKTPIMVISYAQEGAVNMRAYYLPLEGLTDCRTLEDISAFFEGEMLPVEWVLAE